mgnify:CR=1 FL=1
MTLRQFISTLLFLSCTFIYAQDSNLVLKGKDLPSILWINEYEGPIISSVADIPLRLTEIRKQGFWLSQIYTQDSSTFFLALGPALGASSNFLFLAPDSLPPHPFEAVSGLVSDQDFMDTKAAFLNHYLNLGFPFASINTRVVSADSILVSVVPGPHFVFDDLEIVGDIKIPSRKIQASLHYPYQKAYREDYLLKLNAKKHPFLRHEKPAAVLFAEGKAYPYLYLKSKKSQSFSGIIGFNGNGSDFNFVGNLHVKLKNSFNRMENLQLDWEQFQNQGQQFSFQAGVPYLWGSHWGWNFEVDVFRQDSTFVNSGLALGIEHQFSLNTELQFQYLRSGVNFLGESAAIDIQRQGFGLGFLAQGSTGPLEHFESNIQLFNREQIDLSRQLKLNGEAAFNFPLGKLFQWHHSFHFHGIFASQEITRAELYRLGGFKSIRGFNEQQFFTPLASYTRNEIRLLLQQGSFIYLLSDHAFLQAESEPDLRYFSGLGLGLAFQTKGGTFQLAYALGAQSGSFDPLAQAKIHFGFTNTF